MIITSKTGEQFNFLETGVEGIYVLDHAAFRGQFDEESNNDWEKSSGKKKLQKWAENNLPKEILEQFEVDIPTAEEVFSQKMLNLYESGRKLKSKQFPIFKDSNERIKELDGKPIWWWTRSTCTKTYCDVWLVLTDGGMHESSLTEYPRGFVPVLRRKTK